MNKWLPTLLTLGGTVLTVATPSIQSWLGSFASSHTKTATVIGAGFAIISHLWTSPLSSAQENTKG